MPSMKTVISQCCDSLSGSQFQLHQCDSVVVLPSSNASTAAQHTAGGLVLTRWMVFHLPNGSAKSMIAVL